MFLRMIVSATCILKLRRRLIVFRKELALYIHVATIMPKGVYMSLSDDSNYSLLSVDKLSLPFIVVQV